MCVMMKTMKLCERGGQERNQAKGDDGRYTPLPLSHVNPCHVVTRADKKGE